MNRFLISFLLGLLATCAQADEPDERHQLQQRRAAIETRFTQDSQACQQHFNVNSCMDGVRAARIAALKPITAREQVLEAQDRKLRSEAQAARVAERQRDFAAEEGRRRTEALQSPPVAHGGGTAGHAAEAGPAPSPHAPPVDPEVHAKAIRKQADDAAATANLEREELNRRQRLVLQHQQDLRKRQEGQQAQSGRKPGAPLPIPSAAQIAATPGSAPKP